MRVLLVGPPASGKGTQGRRIGAHFAVPYLSSGERLRAEMAAGTALGQRVARDLARGDLVPDDVLDEALQAPIEHALRRGGYVLDGYPRTVVQAGRFDTWAAALGGSPQAACWFDVGDEELLRRSRGRAAAEGRVDDTESVARHRIAVYLEATTPLLEHYRRAGILIHIDAAQEVDAVTAEVLGALDRLAAGRREG